MAKLSNLTLARCSLTDTTCLLLLDYLEECPSLEQLDLSENQITEITLTRFADILGKPDFRLKCLSLRDNSLKSKTSSAWEGPHQAEDSEDCPFSKVLRSLQHNRSLQILDLSHNYLNFSEVSLEVFQCFSLNESLVYFLLGSNRLICNTDSSDAFGLFLMHLPMSLAHLNLSNVGLVSVHAQQVYSATLLKPALKHLCLSHNMLGRDSTHILGSLLLNNTHLCSLELCNNNLWGSGASILGNSLQTNTTLLSLKLSRNHIGRAALDLVTACTSSENCNLRFLDLRKNDLSKDITEQIQEMVNNRQLSVVIDSSGPSFELQVQPWGL